MQKYLIFVFTFIFFSQLNAQEELDSTDRKEDSRLKDLIWVKDTSYNIFRTMKFSNMKVLYPSFKTYRRFIDTSAAGAQSDVTQYAMYNSFWNRLRIQYTRLQKKLYKAGVEWDKTTLDSFYIDSGGTGSNEYVYVHWILKTNKKKKYHISALYLNMKGKWFLMDELKYEGMIVEKKKKPKKKVK